MSGESFVYFFESLTKALVYSGTFTGIGACTFRWLLLPHLKSQDLISLKLRQKIISVGLGAAWLTILALLLRAWAHTAAAFGFEDSLTWENIYLIAVKSRWSEGWKLQCLAAVTVLSTFLWTRRHETSGWAASSLAVLVLAATLPLLGHASGNAITELLHTVHILSAGTWLGTLFVLMVASSAQNKNESAESKDLQTILLRKFSTVAMIGAGVLVASGIVSTTLHLGNISNLWITPYGRTLIIKILIFLGIAACGYTNWRYFQRAENTTVAPRHKIIIMELTLAAAAILITGMFTELPRPHH
jgi:putative copper export protein